MKKKIKIGIPRAFLYYRNYVLWKTFFEGIGCKIILSPVTNREIIDEGKSLSIDESCLPSKIYVGHVSFLKDKCDYVLIPRVSNYGRKKRVCMKFYGIYDVVSNFFSDMKVINYNIDNLKFKYEIFGFIKMGLKVSKNIFKILFYYFLGKKKEKDYNESLVRSQDNILKSNKLKILIVAHPYIIYDEYLGGSIIKYLKDNDIQILYSDRMDRKESINYARDFSKTLYWLYAKENIGSVSYYKSAIDGIIYLSSFPCGVDSLVNELAIRKTFGIPSINIVLDELSSDTGIQTRMESFVDIIKARRDNG